MRALILSDIHANLDALEAVIAQAPAHDVVWNLGDVVGYGACPNEVIDHVRSWATINVRGNHDRACSGLIELKDFNLVAAFAARWTQDQLTEENLLWLRQLEAGPALPENFDASCSHGSLLDEDEYVVTTHDAWLPLHRSARRINFFGHTHLQGGFATSNSEWFQLQPEFASREGAEEYPLHLRAGARYLLNPGSVGQPRDKDWRAAFAIYDNAMNVVSFYRVPYDVQSAQSRIMQAGLPDRLALRLSEGR